MAAVSSASARNKLITWSVGVPRDAVHRSDVASHHAMVHWCGGGTMNKREILLKIYFNKSIKVYVSVRILRKKDKRKEFIVRKELCLLSGAFIGAVGGGSWGKTQTLLSYQ